ncbi:MAG: fimbrillin family protein [Candidatus Cryptobacteroides sp.]|nr:fimbrillin family protein [Candidatus Cryptobacteroides sp.]
MKKILLFASAALLFAGCAKENITPTENPDNNSQKGDITLSFSASQTGFGTKAIIGETATDAEGAKSTAINWQSTDQISVFDGDNKNCPFSTKDFSAEATSCTFEGNVTKLATDYTAVYPYTEGATISEDVISGISLPAIQTAVAGSFDPSAALMAAKTVSGGRELAFKNLVGYVKVTTDFDCKKIELCAASGEKLAGVGSISFTDGDPSFTLGEGAEPTITLLPAGEGTTIAAGKTYYIAVPATTLATGWNISFTATDDKVYSRQGSKPIQFKTNTVINLGTIYLNDFIPYVTFTAENSQSFSFYPENDFHTVLGEKEYFEYSVGGGEWIRFRTEGVENVPFGGSLGKLRLRGKSIHGTALDITGAYSTIRFNIDNSPVDCTGDIRTLIDYEDYANASAKDAKFSYLFYGNKALRTAPDLPSQDLVAYCYYNMFSDCSSLTTTPDLPAKTLTESCYELMFANCTSLTTVTSLPAYELADNCYYGMFTFCVSLTNLPALPEFSSLAPGCFKSMFQYCYALETAPRLWVQSLAADCFAGMFFSCTKLSSVTLFIDDPIIAESFNPELYFFNWLNGAGTKADSPQLDLVGAIGGYYEIFREYLTNDNCFPENWTVLY